MLFQSFNDVQTLNYIDIIELLNNIGVIREEHPLNQENNEEYSKGWNDACDRFVDYINGEIE